MATGGDVITYRIRGVKLARLWILAGTACVRLGWFAGMEFCVNRAARAVRADFARIP